MYSEQLSLQTWVEAGGRQVTDSSGCQAMAAFLYEGWIFISILKGSGKQSILPVINILLMYWLWIVTLLDITQNSGDGNCVHFCMEEAKILCSYPLNDLFSPLEIWLVYANFLLSTNYHFPKLLKHFTFGRNSVLDLCCDCQMSRL